MKNITIAIAGICALVLLAVGGFFLWQQDISLFQTDSGGAGIYKKMLTLNPSFKSGMEALRTDSFSEAARLFKEAGTQTTDPVEHSIALSYEAHAEANARNYETAVAIFKTIAGDTANSAKTRAYAVQNLGLMYFRSKDPRITAAIFSDEPYKPMFDSSNIRLSYRRLFDYAVSIYPYALSAYSSAQWFANGIVNTQGSSTIPVAQKEKAIARYTRRIQERLLVAQPDFENVMRSTSDGSDMLYTLEKRASLLGTLSIAGLSQFEDPERAYVEAVDAYTKYGNNQDGFLRIEYAVFLANKYGDAREQGIRSVLSPLYEGDLESRGIGLSDYLRLERSDRRYRQFLVRVAAIDPRFKDLLITSGWANADFATSTSTKSR